MIKFVTAKDVLPLRSEVLRNGRLKPEDCVFTGDNEAGSFHLGYFEDDVLICIVSFHPRNLEEYSGTGYQLRGMATSAAYRGKGFGNKLVNFAIVYLKGKKASYIWCKARKVAFGFYQALGFEFISEEYEIPDIGPHKSMYLRIQ